MKIDRLPTTPAWFAPTTNHASGTSSPGPRSRIARCIWSRFGATDIGVSVGTDNRLSGWVTTLQ